MAHLKPLSPIQLGEDYIYPLTSYDQIVMENGKRWDGISAAADAVKVDMTDAEYGEANLINADSLGGKLAEDYQLKANAAADSLALDGKAPEYYLTPKNLLDNSDFTNPVNQRGVTTVTTTGRIYTIDRWVTSSSGGEFTFEDGIITNANYLWQVFNNLEFGKVYTASISFDNEIVVVSAEYVNHGAWTTLATSRGTNGTVQLAVASNGDLFVGIATRSGITNPIRNAALYEGAYTIETLPPYVPKGYAAELAECQRYFYRANVGYSSSVIPGFTLSDTTVRATIVTPQPMRITPSITVNTVGNINVYTGDTGQAATAISLYETNGNNVVVLVTTQELIAWRSCVVRFNTRVDLSADL